MAITLVIKGTIEQAKEEAKKRHISLTECKTAQYNSVKATTGSRFAQRVMDWYHARKELGYGKGYPPGTLMLYRER